MESIDTFFEGYQFGKQRAADLERCRKSGAEFLAGRAQDGQGKDVYDVLDKIKRVEDEQYKTGSGLSGYLTYQLLHPIQSYRDNRDITTIILSEVRSV